ncbi:MAG: UDP-N-acetylglucosamine 2-epimerase (non-hydrolyzing) [Candidatus Neomarinimicrobiota bacterium]
MKIIHVVGARPNFMKLYPVWKALDQQLSETQIIVHTGQHYDDNMSDIFFDEFGLPKPHHNLDIGSGSHGDQTAKIIQGLEKLFEQLHPHLILVYGDVNSTLGGALVCSKMLIKIAHVEAGLRSFDRTMPEEINRLLTDQISDYLFTPSEDANRNLINEGIAQEKIHFVGNVMIDTLKELLPMAKSPAQLLDERPLILVTLHRPSNVDDPLMLKEILNMLQEISKETKVIFPVHPRTQRRINEFRFDQNKMEKVEFIKPLGYLEFLGLLKHARCVLTDSGGIQEETTYLGIPCVTLRKNTERPVTVTLGTNQVLGEDLIKAKQVVLEQINKKSIDKQIPPLWDGKAGQRIAAIIRKNIDNIIN